MVIVSVRVIPLSEKRHTTRANDRINLTRFLNRVSNSFYGETNFTAPRIASSNVGAM